MSVDQQALPIASRATRSWSVWAFLKEERDVIVAFLFSRVVIWGVAWFSALWLKPGPWMKKTPRGPFWDYFFHWDAGWLLSIYQNGYNFVPGQESNVAFFPLYPLAAGSLGTLCRISGAAGGFLLSNLCVLGAASILRRVVSVDFPDRPRVALRSVWLFLFTPAAVFYTAFYSESLFLFLSLLSCYSARRGRWFGAGLAGALLSATRSNGVVILPALMWEAWQRRRDSLGQGCPVQYWRFLGLGLVPLGLVSYMAYLFWRFGDPLAFLKAQSVWGRTLAAPWTSLIQAVGYDQAYARLFIGAAIAAIFALLAAFWMRVRVSMLIYAALMLLLVLSSNLLESVPRYVSAIFPLYIGVAAWTERSENLFTALMMGSVAVMTLCTALFVCGYWMT